MPEHIRAHVNLFGTWAGEWTAQDVYDRKLGTNIICQHLEAVLETKVENLDISEIERFKELSPHELDIPVVPDEQKLVGRLLRPLKSAKRLYCFQEYLATIALSGLVGEFSAMLVYRARKPQLGTQQITKDQEKRLFGDEFDKLGQHRRVEVLRGFGYVGEEQEHLFSELRLLRKKYLHLWEVDDTQIQTDARKCFMLAMRLFKQISGLAFSEDGAFIMNDYLLGYIKKEEKEQ